MVSRAVQKDMARAMHRSWRPYAHLMAAALLAVTLCSTLFLLYALSSSPSPQDLHHLRLRRASSSLQIQTSIDSDLGPFGHVMLSFLPSDLPFTVFIPSPSSFQSFLLALNQRFNLSGNVSPNSTSSQDESNYAVVSRIFGFSAVPRRIISHLVPLNAEMTLDSVSGFRLNLVRLHPKGTLVVNNLACNTVDIIRGSIVVHLVDGIIMDSDFEQSVLPFDEQDGGI